MPSSWLADIAVIVVAGALVGALAGIIGAEFIRRGRD
jgi:hypothetical protein